MRIGSYGSASGKRTSLALGLLHQIPFLLLQVAHWYWLLGCCRLGFVRTPFHSRLAFVGEVVLVFLTSKVVPMISVFLSLRLSLALLTFVDE